jgi:hypothetical protein
VSIQQTGASAAIAEFGFERHPSNPDATAVTWNGWPCEHFITVDNVDWASNFGTPEDVGVGYYNAGPWDGSSKLFFRISYQHELLRCAAP